MYIEINGLNFQTLTKIQKQYRKLVATMTLQSVFQWLNMIVTDSVKNVSVAFRFFTDNIKQKYNLDLQTIILLLHFLERTATCICSWKPYSSCGRL